MHPQNLKLAIIASVVASMAFMACAKVPYTGRRQLNAIPSGLMNQMGAQSYTEMLASVPVRNTGDANATLARVGQRISKVANKPSYDWEYTLIDEPTVNAWCLPGGKIGFYTGILPTLKHESGMSFVMGHEVGHAIASHGAERMTQQLGLMGGMTVLQAWASGQGKLTEQQQGLLFSALGLGAEVGVILPFSRAHENEADVLGMMYMADAGYPPTEAPEVWTRMGALGGERPPTFLSTHPSPEGRKKNLAKWMPQANKKYARNKRAGDFTKTLWQ